MNRPAIAALAAVLVTVSLSTSRSAAENVTGTMFDRSQLWPEVVNGEVLAYETKIKTTGSNSHVFVAHDSETVTSASNGGVEFSETAEAEGSHITGSFTLDSQGRLRDVRGKDVPSNPFFVYNATLFGPPLLPLRQSAAWRFSVPSRNAMGPPGTAQVTVTGVDAAKSTVSLAIDFAGASETPLVSPINGRMLKNQYIAKSHTDVEFRRGILQRWHRTSEDTEIITGQPPVHLYIDDTIRLVSDRRP